MQETFFEDLTIVEFCVVVLHLITVDCTGATIDVENSILVGVTVLTHNEIEQNNISFGNLTLPCIITGENEIAAGSRSRQD